jgi:hypothetical protein
LIPAAPVTHLEYKPLDNAWFSGQAKPSGLTIGIAFELTLNWGAWVVVID